MATENKSAAIRALNRQGKTPKQIIELGYCHATVYDALRRSKARRGLRQMVEESLAVSLEILRLVRGTDLPVCPDLDVLENPRRRQKTNPGLPPPTG